MFKTNRSENILRLIDEWNKQSSDQKIRLMLDNSELYNAIAWLVRTEEIRRGL